MASELPVQARCFSVHHLFIWKIRYWMMVSIFFYKFFFVHFIDNFLAKYDGYTVQQ